MPDWFQGLGEDAVGPLLTALVTAAALVFLKRGLRGAKETGPVETGVIHVSRLLMWSSAIFAMLLAALFIVLMVFERDDPTALVWGPMGFGFFTIAGIGSSLSLSPYYHLVWFEEGLEGPAKGFHIGWKCPRLRMLWSEIVNVKTKPNGTVVIRSQSGGKIYYSQYHTGYGRFEATLRSKRPDLFLSDEA